MPKSKTDFTNFIDARPNYFPGQFLLEDDFEIEQKYFMDRQKYHRQSLYVSGIIEGLDVEVVQDKPEVLIKSGSAVNGNGDLIVLKKDVSFSQFAALTVGELYISYKEEKQVKQQEDFTRWQEVPTISFAATTPDEGVRLAKISIVDNVPKLDLTVRNYSGIFLPNATGSDLTLRSGGSANPSLAILNGHLTVTGTITGKINASNINAGVLDIARIPDLPPSKIASGTLTVDSIPSLPADKITSGTIQGSLTINTGGTSGWDKLVINTTSNWGDGSNQYVTIGTSSGIMLHSPHVSWYAAEKRASVRYGRTGGVVTGSFWDVGVRESGAFSFALNGTDHKMTIDSGGNLRVTGGITIPGSSDTTLLKVGAELASTANIDLSGHVQLKEFGTNNLAYLQARNDSSNRNIGLRIRTQKQGTTNPEMVDALTISPAGNVGIGTANPSQKLEVAGNLKVTGTIAVSGDFTVPGSLSLGGLSFDTAVKQQKINLWKEQYGIGIQSNTQYFRTGNNFAWYKGGSHAENPLDSGGGTVQMVIKDGNVGIGTTDPSQKLEVAGNLKVTGAITIPGSSGTLLQVGAELASGANIDLAGHVQLREFGTNNLAYLQARNDSSNRNIGLRIRTQKQGTTNPEVVEALTISSAGDLTLSGKLDFGTSAKQMINLWSTGYGIGIQGDTQYFRTGRNFAWYKGGVHNEGVLNPGEGGVVQMVIKDGNVGIGTADPTRGKVHIEGSVNYQDASGYRYFVYRSETIPTYSSNNAPYSLYASSRIGCPEFNAFSDLRIKEIKGNSNSKDDLQTLLQIQVTDYYYKDKIANDNKPKKKVIGQQIAAIYPQAVSTHTDIVPDILQFAVIAENWVTLNNHNLKIGDKVKILWDDNETKLFPVEAVEADKFKISLNYNGDIFAYGREVDDFHVVDYDALSMLHISATQEIYRMIKKMQSEVSELKKEKSLY